MPPPTELSGAESALATSAPDKSGEYDVARPTSTAEVAAVLRDAARDGLTVVPRGRGTKLSWGMPPSSVDLLLDLSGLDRVLDHAAGDLIVEAQAGTLLSDVQQVVGEAGQRLGVDESVPGASVGGTLATHASGPLRMSTGTMRDLLIGVTLVRADGVVAKSGGRVVKNVAGYDLGKLVVGSFGTLAVVTEALFRLHPLPEVRRWLEVPVADPDEALERSQQVLHSQCVPAALEVEWGADGGSVRVLLEGREAGVAARARTVGALWGQGTAESQPPAGCYPWDTAARGDDRSTAVKATFALSGLADVLRSVDAAPAEVRLQGSAGVGVVYAAVDGDPDDVVTTVLALRETCTRRGGSAVVLDAPAAVKGSVDLWGEVPALDLMRRLKDRFDPDHRLSPGRFVGGI
jgi:glycolate oxidase FAD binding subunit